MKWGHAAGFLTGIVLVGCTGGFGRSAEGDSPAPKPSAANCAGKTGGCASTDPLAKQTPDGVPPRGGALGLNNMDPKCRKVYKYRGTVDGSAVLENFEWDFSGDTPVGSINYSKDNIPPVPITVKLAFQEQTSNAYVYEVTEIEGAGQRPDKVSFTCNGQTMSQKESRLDSSGKVRERSFTLEQSS
jgi:hypothetical protein